MVNKDELDNTVKDKKERIIQEATVLFYKDGYDNTSIRELSKPAELSVAGIYYFFKDKEAILYYILYQSIIELHVTIESSISETDDPVTNLRRIIENMLRHVIRHKMEIIILNREDGRLQDEQRATITEKRTEAYFLMKKELSKLEAKGALKPISLSTAIFTIFAMTTWFARWYRPDGPRTLEELSEEMTTIFFDGVLA